jgi:hypothetical protein
MNKIALLAYPLVAAVSLAAAGAAFAESPTPDTTAQTVSTKTRAQVQAELAQARADGSIKVSSNHYNPLPLAKSEKTREAVRAEAIAARQAGHDAAYYGEDSGSFALSRQPAVKAAAPVYAGAAVGTVAR